MSFHKFNEHRMLINFVDSLTITDRS